MLRKVSPIMTRPLLSFMIRKSFPCPFFVSFSPAIRSTGLFDQSFTETVIDYADFQAASTGAWWRVENGMQQVTDAMQSCLASTSWPAAGSAAINVTTQSPVVALSNDTTTSKISVTVAGKRAVEYDMVFNTTALGPLQQMDLEGLALPDNVLTGIRSLSYDRATKVAIRFSSPWWKVNGVVLKGGISQSDLSISNVVYPSWDVDENSAVLMVSYSWAQDATRMASLVPDYNLVPPTKDDQLITLCLKNLAKLWSNSPSYDDLYGMYVSHHAWAWEHDPWTGGAFALFGPGQFKNVYNNFQTLFCKDKLAICGEAISAHHAWISGALDSAFVKMIMFLTSQGRGIDIAKLMLDLDSPFSVPLEMDEELVKWAVLLGDGGGPKGWGDELGLRKGNGSK